LQCQKFGRQKKKIPAEVECRNILKFRHAPMGVDRPFSAYTLALGKKRHGSNKKSSCNLLC
jgi:hypothetical protein